MKIKIIILFSLLQINCSKSRNEKLSPELIENWNESTLLFLNDRCDSTLIGKTRFLNEIKDDSIRNKLLNKINNVLINNTNEIYILEKSNVGGNLYDVTIWTKENDPVFNYDYDKESKEFVEKILYEKDKFYEYKRSLFYLDLSESCTFEGEGNHVFSTSIISIFKYGKIETKVVIIN